MSLITLGAVKSLNALASELPTVDVYIEDALYLNEAAQTQQTLSTEELDQRQATKLEELAIYLPNIQAARVGAGGSEDFIIRGFSLGGRLMLDGVLGNQNRFVRDPATLDSVEFVKGHASVLYGSGAPGGTVNFVSKKPQAKQENTFKVVFGNDNYKRTVMDSTGALVDNLSYRTILAGTDADTWKENVRDRQFTFMNSLDWQYNSGGKLSATYEISHQTYPWDFDNVYANGAPVYDVSYVHPATSNDQWYQRLSLGWEQAIDEHSWIEAQTHVYVGDREERKVGFYFLWRDDQPLFGYYQDSTDDYLQASGKIAYLRNYQLGDWQGTWQFGLSKVWLDDKFDSDLAAYTFTLDIYNPDFDVELPSKDQLVPRDIYTKTAERGVFLFNQMELADELSLSFGLRKSNFETRQTINDNQSIDNQNSDISYSAGMIWEFAANHKLYASYSDSFLPNVDTDRNGESFDPKEGVQYELGWLYQPSSDLHLQLSAFDITQTNLLTDDPNDPAYSVLAGTYKARGIELASQWQITPQLKSTLNIGLIKGYVAEDNNGNEGNDFFSVPKRNGSLWLSYQTNSQWLLQGGAVYQGKRAGDLANSFYVDAYTRYDAAIQYQANKQNRFNFTVQNLTDINYVSYSSLNDYVRFGDPRTIRLGWTHHF